MKTAIRLLFFSLILLTNFGQNKTIRSFTLRTSLNGADGFLLQTNTNDYYYTTLDNIYNYLYSNINLSGYGLLAGVNTWTNSQIFEGQNSFSGVNTFTNAIRFNHSIRLPNLSTSTHTDRGIRAASNIDDPILLYDWVDEVASDRTDTVAMRSWVRSNFADTTGGGGGTDTTKVPLTRELTIAGTTNQITVDDTTQDLSEDRRWQIGLANSVTIPNDLTLTNGFITQSGGAENEFSGNIDIATGKVYKINNTSILSSTTLGSSVVNSSLTSVGTIASGTWQGTAIGDSYISSAANWNDAYNKRVNTWNYPLSISSNTVSFGYNTTNLQLTTNQLNTIQNINTTASPTFANMNVGSGGAYRINGVDKFSLNILTLGSTGNQGIINTSGSSVPLSLEPNGYLMISTGSGAILPWFNYTEDIGASFKKFRSIYAGELRVQNLVAEDVMSTIGGRIFVAPSTELIDSVTTSATSIKVKHNNLASGDRVVLENNGNLEWMAITSGGSVVGGGYSYSVTRNLDGTGANAWSKGDGVVNTGTTGDGFIDLYAQQGILGGSTGPTIVGNVRYGTTYNHFSEHWAIGNLNGLYGYATDTYGAGYGRYESGYNNWVIDATNGIRFRNYTTTIGSWNGSTITLGEVAASKSNIIISSGALKLRNNTTDLIVLNADGTATFAGNITSTATISGGEIKGAEYRTHAASDGSGEGIKIVQGSIVFYDAFGTPSTLEGQGSSVKAGYFAANYIFTIDSLRSQGDAIVQGDIRNKDIVYPKITVSGTTSSRVITVDVSQLDDIAVADYGFLTYWFTTNSDPSAADPGVTNTFNTPSETNGRNIKPTTVTYTDLNRAVTDANGIFKLTITGIGGGTDLSFYMHVEIQGKVYTSAIITVRGTAA